MPAGISCKQIATCPQHGPVQQLFLLVTWHGSSNGSSDTDTDTGGPQTFDVVLTDCSNAWQLTGGSPQGAARLQPEAWQRAHEALSDTSPAATTYTFWASEAPQECKLFWAWQGRGAGQDVLYVTLQQAADASAAIHAMMAHMMASYSSVQSALAVSSDAAARLQGSLAAQGLALRQEVAAARQREADLMVKFALLQNRQVAENKRLRAELDHCREQLVKLQGEDEFNTDDEERAAELGAAYAAETDEDSDEAMQEESPAAPAGGSGAGGSSAADEPAAAAVPPAAAAAAAAAAGGASMRPTLGLPGLLGRLMSDLDDEGTTHQQQPQPQQPQLQQDGAAGDGGSRAAAAGPAPVPEDFDAATQPLPSLDREQVYLNVEQWRQQQQQQQQQDQQPQAPLLPDGQAQAAAAPGQQVQAAADFGVLAEELAPVVSKARRRRR